MSELDALASHILGMTPRVPLYAATTALARLSRLQQRLALTLSSQDASVSAGACAYFAAFTSLQAALTFTSAWCGLVQTSAAGPRRGSCCC